MSCKNSVIKDDQFTQDAIIIDYINPSLVDKMQTIIADAPPLLPEHSQNIINAALVCDTAHCCHDDVIV